jgi:hypothetical protein
MTNLALFVAAPCVLALLALAFPHAPASSCRGRPRTREVLFQRMLMDDHTNRPATLQRRSFLGVATAAALTVATSTPASITVLPVPDDQEQEWKRGTSLSLLSLDDAYQFVLHGPTGTFPFFAQWPDPILRRPALPTSCCPLDWDSLHKLQAIAKALKQKADQHGAVGLAAQQCGIHVSLVYLSSSSTSRGRSHPPSGEDLFLVNPRIVARSPEREMRVWTEYPRAVFGHPESAFVIATSRPLQW